MSGAPNRFSVYIDESGDTGIAKIRSGKSGGASPYFVLGAVVCQPTSEPHAKNALADFRETIGKQVWKHATDLGHPEKVLFARELGRLPMRYFCLISNKATLGAYKSQINNNPQLFYNKCVVYLLENICGYLALRSATEESLQVVLEERNHDYDKLRAYIAKVRETPHHTKAKDLRILNPFSISTRKKGEEDMLEIADFVAHAVFQCTNKTRGNYGIPEPRYFSEISSRFAGDGRQAPLGVGIKCLHKLRDLGLDKEIEELLKSTKVRAPS